MLSKASISNQVDRFIAVFLPFDTEVKTSCCYMDQNIYAKNVINLEIKALQKLKKSLNQKCVLCEIKCSM